MNKNSKIYIAGHNGMVGSAIHRCLISNGYNNFVFRTKEEMDVTRQQEVENFFEKEKPEYVIDSAAKVGGIVANDKYRAEFIYDNLMIQNNIIHSSYKYGVKKLLFLGSSCIYPMLAPQPLKEEYLLTGVLEKTNDAYAIAKITGIKMCENYYKQYGCNFISVMPTNLIGQNDNFNLETSHVLPAMIRKMHIGKCLKNNDWETIRKDLNNRPIDGINGTESIENITKILFKYGIFKDDNDVNVSLWGTGRAYREFMHADDMAEACVYILENIDLPIKYFGEDLFFMNIGTGVDQTILEVSEKIKNIVEFTGNIIWDTTKPDGTPKKLLDISLLKNTGFKHKYSLEDSIKKVYEEYRY